jgi:hypothetical protein
MQAVVVTEYGGSAETMELTAPRSRGRARSGSG